MQKIVQVHMLPTENKNKVHPQLFKTTKNRLVLVYELLTLTNGEDATPQHLYFTSEEEIKEGDWYINQDNVVFQAKKLMNQGAYIHCRKIVASTDPRLTEK